MTNGWPIKTLGDVCERVTVGHVGITSPYYRDEGILFLRTQNVGKSGLVLDDMKFVTPEFHASLKKSEVKAGDVLMSRVITHTVHCAIIPPDLGPANCANVVLVRPAAGLLPEFLIYYIRSSEAQRHLLDRKVGSAQLVVNTKVVQTWPIPVPPLAEQRRIVGILDEAFEAIATAKANAEQNLQNARALFESHLNAVFTQRGDGWVEKPLGDVVRFEGGSQPSKDTFIKEPRRGYVRLIQIRDYKTDNHIVYIAEKHARRRCRPDDVMIGRYGPPLFQILRGIEGAYNVALMKATPDETQVTKDYLYYFLKNDEILAHVIRSSNRAAGQAGVNKETLEPYPIPFPRSLSAQSKIVMRLESVRSETQRLESIYQRKLAALDELKKSLLHQAFSGQL